MVGSGMGATPKPERSGPDRRASASALHRLHELGEAPFDHVSRGHGPVFRKVELQTAFRPVETAVVQHLDRAGRQGVGEPEGQAQDPGTLGVLRAQ